MTDIKNKTEDDYSEDYYVDNYFRENRRSGIYSINGYFYDQDGNTLNPDNYLAMLGGLVVAGIVVAIPEFRALGASLSGYYLGNWLVEKTQNIINKRKTTV